MKVIENALAYVTRKKNRTLIVFIILSLVLSSLYACLNVLKSSDDLEKSLYKSSNSSISITKKAKGNENGYFNLNEFKGLDKIKEIDHNIPQYNSIAKLISGKVVDAEEKIKRDDIPENMKNVVEIEATSETKKNILFNSGVFSLKEGRNIEKNDVNKILVHEEFAKKNNLKLNDKVSLELVNNSDSSKKIQKQDYQIVGIFSGKKQEKFTGLSSDFSENMMFTDYASSQKALNISDENKIVNKISIFTESPEKMDEVISKIKKLDFDSSKYNIEKDSNSFKEALESLDGVKHIIKIMTYAIVVAGASVLSLILVLWLRERIYEIGILLSIGVSKIKIISQFIIELIFISIPTIIVSLVLGNVIVKQIISGMISSENTESLPSNFISGGYSLDTLTTFVKSYGLLVFIILVSVIIASSMILIKKPKEILSKIS